MTPGVANTNPWLSSLHPPLPPPEPPLWPPAPGWWLLALLVLGVALAWSLRYWQRWRRDRYRRVGLRELALIRQQLKNPARRVAALRALPQLLHRVARAAVGAQRGRSSDNPDPLPSGGPDWWLWLDSGWQGGTFAQGPGALLHRFAYAPDAQLHVLPEEQVDDLCQRVEGWIRGHTVGGARC